MKAAWSAADRAAELQSAAHGWRAAGLIDEAAHAAIAAEARASGPLLGPIWRALVFVCVTIGVSTATFISFITFGVREPLSAGALLLVLGAALAAATEIVLDRTSFRSTGAEAATSLLAASYLCVAAFALLGGLHLGEHQTQRLAFPWCAVFFGLTAWRWGLSLYAAPAVAFALLWSAQFPGGRPLWIAVGALIAAGSSVAGARCDLAPSHRTGLEIARVVALAGIYLAVNYLSLDRCFIEEFGRGHGDPHPRAGFLGLKLSLVGSALFPAVVLSWGLRTRQRALIGFGILTAALSLITIRYYLHLAPLWVVLAGAGSALAGTSLLLDRWLRSGPDGERFGFTAAPLHDETRRERLLPVAAALAAAPAARAVPEEPHGVSGRGGGFGGGGADGSF